MIYIVLGILYESFIHPITILSGLPSAVFGALLTLLLFHKELDLYAFVGIIMLFGVVKKNAIMMIDFAIERAPSRKTAHDAIWQGCLLRFRPIMMTTVAALFGTLPIALGYGEGADARQPLGLAVVGGLVVSQFLTLYITPVIYLYLDALQEKLRGSKRTAQAQPELVADSFVAHALLRAASRLISTLEVYVSPERRDESRRGTQECVRYRSLKFTSTIAVVDTGFPSTVPARNFHFFTASIARSSSPSPRLRSTRTSLTWPEAVTTMLRITVPCTFALRASSLYSGSV